MQRKLELVKSATEGRIVFGHVVYRGLDGLFYLVDENFKMINRYDVFRTAWEDAKYLSENY